MVRVKPSPHVNYNYRFPNWQKGKHNTRAFFSKPEICTWFCEAGEACIGVQFNSVQGSKGIQAIKCLKLIKQSTQLNYEINRGISGWQYSQDTEYIITLIYREPFVYINSRMCNQSVTVVYEWLAKKQYEELYCEQQRWPSSQTRSWYLPLLVVSCLMNCGVNEHEQYAITAK